MLNNWHPSFAPNYYLTKVNVDELIERNRVYVENKKLNGEQSCMLCNSIEGSGLLLNDRSFICKSCFSKVATIKYPEIYENNNRNYLLENEARRIALEAFEDTYRYKKKLNVALIFATSSLLLIFLHISMLIVTIILFIIAFVFNLLENKKLQEWHEKRDNWEIKYPRPPSPVLKHFHEPEAILTEKDYKILKIFNNWPGYPPFWNYLREFVLNRDRNHCQVNGCPSRVTLHVHHKIPVSKGGEHVPDNLITLCGFHHALEPDEGHERTWNDIKTRYITIVREHSRNNSLNLGHYIVQSHLRRLALTVDDELNEIKKYHSFTCRNCNSPDISISVNKKVNIICNKCKKIWVLPAELTEETGPRIAEMFTINTNKGSWRPRWEMLPRRTNVYSEGISASCRDNIKIIENSTCNNYKKNVLCPNCGSTMKLIMPKDSDTWKPFWGCSKYLSEKCHGKRQV